ncbi:serine hydrolase domain-containing protein [Acerihabitans sp. TG2]|uniref:serine hydrolase domain-containing protein n=1 Tax=Acerihabitans sp. TG2 TaxID=3096008 RepID=UPI002B23046F|nr:serine hydrolase domain-containing protein [Acerihabitans sp. TG2]MEA9391881.1 serine hydrolase domain-containing protein [Acerihabitans sp. TG2]
MITIIKRITLILSVLLLSACSTLSNLPVDAVNVADQNLAPGGSLRAEVDSLSIPLLTAGQTPGLVVGVLQSNGRKSTFGYGVTDYRDGYSINGETLFAVGSVSKGFIAEITAILVHRGLLHWDETLTTLLPSNVVLSADARKITLLQLVTHTSGLPRQMMTSEMLASFIDYLFTGKNFYHSLDNENAVNYLATFRKPAKFEPRYSNLGYALLDDILQRRTGKTVTQLLADNITRPLGLTHSGYEACRLPGYARRALGHAGDQPKFIRRGQVVPDWHFSSLMVGAASLYTNADDLLSYAQAHFNTTGDPALDAALHDALTVRYERTREAAALGWIVDSVGDQRITYQVGFIGGYSSYIGLDRRHHIAVVVLQNSFNWTNNIGHRLLQRLGEAADRQAIAARVNGAGAANPLL